MKKDFTQALKYTAKVLDVWLPSKIQYDRMPGLSVGIFHNGKQVYQKGFGYADVEAKIPATAETCYRIASISKTFTSVAIMQLVEQGKLRLDDHVQAYLPWFKAKVKDADAAHVTIRQILSHTGGVFRDGDTPHWQTGKFPDAATLRKSISNKTTVFENLTQFKYSNFGFALLGEVIQKISGSGYDAYVQKNIIEKIGLTCTASDFTKNTEAWLAKGYSRPIPGEERKAFPHTETKAYTPATGFLSNVSDLGKYLSALSLKRTDNRLVHRESKKEMMRAYADAESNLYGLGFSVHTIAKRKVVGHGGGFPGFITKIALDPENDISVVVLSNANDSNADPINVGIFETIYSCIDGKNTSFEGKTVVGQNKFEGVYRSLWSDMIIVGFDNHLVAFDPKTNSPLEFAEVLSPKDKNTFHIHARSLNGFPGEAAQFVFDKKGKNAKKVVWGATPFERV